MNPPKLPQHVMDVVNRVKADSLTVVGEYDEKWRRSLRTNGPDWHPIVNAWLPEDYVPEPLDRPKVLIVTPMHPMYGVKPQTLASVQAAIDAYDGPVDWILSANDNPYPEPYENVLYQHNKARQMVLEGDYDALLSIEADMVVPPDTISGLLGAGGDIAYGLYVWRHRPQRWSAYKTITLWGGESYSLDGEADLSGVWGSVVEVAGLGMGCTLIHRRVLEALPFRLHDGNPGWIADEYGEQFRVLNIDPYRPRTGMVCDDWLLAMDAQHYGFAQRAHLGVVCGHIKDDVVYWPDPEASGFIRTESIGS